MPMLHIMEYGSVWLVIFTGIDFHETAYFQVSEIYAVLIFTVSESGTCISYVT